MRAKAYLATAALAGLLAIPTFAASQNVSISLAWDYPTGGGNDGFAINRKVCTASAYAEIAKIGQLQTYTDTTAPVGQIICYTVTATLGTSRSKPSNEVQVGVVMAPLNLRIQ